MMLEQILQEGASEDQIDESLGPKFWREFISSSTRIRLQVREKVDVAATAEKNPTSLREYLAQEEVISLDDIQSGNISISLFSILGVRQGKYFELKYKAARIKLLPGKLNDYNEPILETIIHNIIHRSARAGRRWKSAYFTQEIVDPEIVEENRGTFARSKALRGYLTKSSYSGSLSSEAATTLGQAFGITSTTESSLIEQLIKYGAYDIRLSEHGLTEEIFRQIVRGNEWWTPRIVGGWIEPWFDSKAIGEEAAQDNRNTLLSSHTFLDYVNSRGINLSNPTEVSEDPILNNLYMQVLKVNPEDTKEIKKYYPDPIPKVGRQSSKIESEWGSTEKKQLYDEFSGMSEDGILDHLRQNKSTLEEIFGRSIHACEMQLRALGILPPAVFSEDEKGIVYSYLFPRIHKELEPVITRVFPNYSSDFEAGRSPSIIPVLAYGSKSVNGEESQEFFHATTPIPYRGNNISDYKPFEREVLATLSAYLKAPGNFIRERNSLRGTMDENPRILHVVDNDMHYAQVFQRARLSSHPELIDTAALIIGSREIYFMKHPQEKVTFSNTRE